MSKIPQKIHMIWIGGEVPDWVQDNFRTWEKHHPSWELKLWTDADLGSFEFRLQSEFEAVDSFASKADIWRYEIVYRYGGFYVDADTVCQKPLNPLLCHSLVVGLEYDGPAIEHSPFGPAIGNCVFGATQEHPAIDHMIRGIPLWLNMWAGKPPTWTTGPGPFTTCVLSALFTHTEVEVMPVGELFSPTETPNCFSVHHEIGSWVEPISTGV